MVIPVSRTGQLRVMHPCATLLSITAFRVRLACVRHAASVRSEPGSNSPKNFSFQRADVNRLNYLYFYSRVMSHDHALKIVS